MAADDLDLFEGLPGLRVLPVPALYAVALAGVAGAAFFALRVPAVELGVVLPSIACAAAAGLAGVELRLRRRLISAEESAEAGGLGALLDSPSRLEEACRALAERVEAATEDPEAAAELKREIEDLGSELVDPVVERRTDLAARFGIAAFARFMAAFARGERLLNRSWSALTDRDAAEAGRALSAAAEAFASVPRLGRPSE